MFTRMAKILTLVFIGVAAFVAIIGAIGAGRYQGFGFGFLMFIDFLLVAFMMVMMFQLYVELCNNIKDMRDYMLSGNLNRASGNDDGIAQQASDDKEWFCKQCGAKNTDSTALFCEVCGKKR